MKAENFKSIIVISMTAFILYLNALAIPVAVLILLMLCDYVTGIISAYISKTLSSSTGLKGILKKLCCLIAVAAAMGVDWVIYITGFNSPDIGTAALLVTVWLTVNEIISIMENLGKIGIPLPKSLLNIVEHLKINSGGK